MAGLQGLSGQIRLKGSSLVNVSAAALGTLAGGGGGPEPQAGALIGINR